MIKITERVQKSDRRDRQGDIQEYIDIVTRIAWLKVWFFSIPIAWQTLVYEVSGNMWARCALGETYHYPDNNWHPSLRKS